MNDIDWFEYERRKVRVGALGLTCAEYEAAINRIYKDLEWEADLPRRVCPNCGWATLRFWGGGYRCLGCQGCFEHSDLRQQSYANESEPRARAGTNTLRAPVASEN